MKNIDEMLQKVLEKSIQLAEQTGEFIITQGGELLEQFFLWHTAQHVLGILLALIIGFVGSGLTRFWSCDEDKGDVKILGRWYEDDGEDIFAWIFICGSWVAATIVFCYHVYYLLFITLAPKLYLIEYFLKK